VAGSFVVSFGLPSPRTGRWVIAGIAKLHQWGGSEGRRAALNRHAALPRDTRGHLREERDQVPSAPETFVCATGPPSISPKNLGRPSAYLGSLPGTMPKVLPVRSRAETASQLRHLWGGGLG